MDKLDFLVKKALSRRGFLAGAGSVAAASALVGCSDDGTVTLPVASTSITDVDILNFALNAEYFEAEFYLRAATGAGLPTSLIGSNPGAVTATTLTKVPTNGNTAQQNIINEIAYTEQQHIAALRSAITNAGGTPISRPALNYDAGFTAVVTAANAISSSLPAIPTTFNPTASFDAFAVASGGFEDLGVTAYTGAAPLLSAAAATNGILAAAGGILAKEAYSAGMMRTILTANAITQGSTTYPYASYFNRLAALYSALGGSGNSVPLAGFGTAPATVASVTASQVVQANASALGTNRTTDQVLHIAYASTTVGASSGGFFPSGFNGNIKTIQS